MKPADGPGDTPLMTMPGGRTSFDVTGEPLKVQLETFLDEHRAALHGCLDGLTEEQARRRLVPSDTTLLGLVKHVTYAERVWFGEAVTGRPRTGDGAAAERRRRVHADRSRTPSSPSAARTTMRAPRPAGPPPA